MLKYLKKLHKKSLEEYITVIEIDSNKVRCAKFLINNEDFVILGVVSEDAHGFLDGDIENPEIAISTIKSSLSRLEKITKIISKKVVLVGNLNNSLIKGKKSINYQAVVSKDFYEKNMSLKDLSLNLKEEHKVINFEFDKTYLDGKISKKPYGLYAKKIDVDYHYTSYHSSLIYNFGLIFEYLNLDFLGVISPIISLPYLVSINNPNANYLYIDNNYTIFSDSKNPTYIPYGVNNVLQNLSNIMGLDITVLKLLEISSSSLMSLEGKNISLNYNGDSYNISYNLLQESINKALLEYFEQISDYIEYNNISSKISLLGKINGILSLSSKVIENLSLNNVITQAVNKDSTNYIADCSDIVLISTLKYYIDNKDKDYGIINFKETII